MSLLASAVMAGTSPSAPGDIQLLSAGRTYIVRAVEGAERPLYSLEELSSALNILLDRRDDSVTVSGSRGSLILENGRPLVRVGEDYVLLSAAVRLAGGRWYVPEDFLTKAANLLLDQKLEDRGGGVFALEKLSDNPVEVRVVNYPDHVSIVFQPGLRAPIQIRELRRSIRVDFDQYLVRLSSEWTTPDAGIVAALRFDPTSQFGSFEIVKGRSFESYRDYELTGPYRKVVDVYRSPLSQITIPQTEVPVEFDRPPEVSGDVGGERAPEYRRKVAGSSVTIDPGHGGEDYGVHPSQEILEKNFNFQIAQEIVQQLETTPFRAELTRTRDISISTDQRSTAVNLSRSRAFVSLHVAGSSDPSLRGAVVFVHRYQGTPSGKTPFTSWVEGQRPFLARSRLLAAEIQSRLNRLFGTDLEVREAPLAVLAPVAAPAVLVEAGFLTNSEDLVQLQDPEFRRRLAGEVVAALLEFLQ